MDNALVEKAKQEAKHRGKSVSKMIADYFATFGEEASPADMLPPVTASLFGILKDNVSEKDYKQHLKDKHL